jgi:hypothetical protein
LNSTEKSLDSFSANFFAFLPLHQSPDYTTIFMNKLRFRNFPSGKNSIAWLFMGISLFLAVRICYFAFSSAVSFDGGVNLQVAQSLANGNGYRWEYAPHPLFSPDVTTGWPYIFPAALIFLLAGTNLVTAQLCNVLYFVAFLSLVFLIIRFAEASSSWTKYLGWILFCAFPLIQNCSMNGYGELPAVFWFLLSCYFLFIRNENKEHSGNIILSGLFAGLSISTKTIMLPACALALAASFWGTPLNLKNVLSFLLQKLPVFVIGLLLPLLLFEGYRLYSIGGVSGYLDFLVDEYKFITIQTGTAPAPAAAEPFFVKLQAHFIFMAASFGFSVIVFGSFLFAELSTVLTAMLLCRKHRAEKFLFCLGMSILLYFVWWFAFTSTNVPNRWIIPAFILLQVAYPVAVAMLLRRFETNRIGTICLLFFLIGTVAVSGRAAFYKIETNTVGMNEVDTREVLEVAKWMNEKKNAQFYGRAFEPGSVVGLYSSVEIRDFCRMPLVQMTPALSHYFVIFPRYTVYKSHWDELSERYKWIDVFPGNKGVKLIQIKPEEYHAIGYDRLDKERIAQNILTPENGKETYMRGRDGHWISSDYEFLLKTSGVPGDFYVDISFPEALYYVHRENIELRFYVNGTEAARRILPLGKAGWKGRIKISQEEMKFPADSLVCVRILSNNVCQFWRKTDEFWRGSQLSAIVDFMGFEDKGGLPESKKSR